MNVAENLERIANRVADAGGDMEAITLVAVTKGFAPDAGRAALAAGIADLGENYAQELLDKVGPVGPGARWHFIGRLQSNKIRKVADVVTLWQSVDRTSLVDEIAKRAPGASVLVQLDPLEQGGKGGAPPGEADELVARATDRGLRVEGVMAVGVEGDADATGRLFASAAAFADRHDLAVRSMGMTGDLELAVAAGTTMIRIGTSLFGARPSTTKVRD